MNEKEFISKFTEIIDTEKEIELSTRLSDLEEWDSLSMVSFFSYCNTTLKNQITPDEIKNAQTVKDLFNFVKR